MQINCPNTLKYISSISQILIFIKIILNSHSFNNNNNQKYKKKNLLNPQMSNSCPNLIVGLSIEIAFALVGNAVNPQNKIVYVNYNWNDFRDYKLNVIYFIFFNICSLFTFKYFIYCFKSVNSIANAKRD